MGNKNKSMEKLEIKPSYKFPRVLFDPANDTYIISGNSIPENAPKDYEDVLNWIDANIPLIKKAICFQFRINYMNSASARVYVDLLNRLEGYYKDGARISVKWFYEDNDDDRENAGLYASCTVLPFQLISYEPDDEFTW